jgi:hypothetical protein
VLTRPLQGILRPTGDENIALIISKTAAGKIELQARAHSLKRSARTLLVLADGVRLAEELLQIVQGADAADIEDLRVAGLVTVTETMPAGTRRPEASAPALPPQGSPGPPSPAPGGVGADLPGEAVSAMGYQDLYAALNMLCRDHLGLIKGFRYSMEIEKASGIEELTAVARRFCAEVEQTKGVAAGQLVRRALALET